MEALVTSAHTTHSANQARGTALRMHYACNMIQHGMGTAGQAGQGGGVCTYGPVTSWVYLSGQMQGI